MSMSASSRTMADPREESEIRGQKAAVRRAQVLTADF
jgi:hypothetical protein